MAIYRVNKNAISAVRETSFAAAGLSERDDMQRLLRDHIEILAPDVLIIAEEFQQWADSNRRIDLLGVSSDADLVVIELKRTDDGGHMELQAIRYAAMVSAMTFDQAVEVFGDYLERGGDTSDPKDRLLQFLGWDEPKEDQFAQDMRIVLASADFSREITTAVMWLNERDLDIRCVRLRPYQDSEGGVLLDIQQVIPLPEAAEYQVQLKTKAQKVRHAAARVWDEASFFADASKRLEPPQVECLRDLLTWIGDYAQSIWWGRGQTVGSFVPTLEFGEGMQIKNHWYQLFAAYSNGDVTVEFAYLRKKTALRDGDIRRRFADHLSRIPGCRSDGSAERRVSIPVASLTNPEFYELFKGSVMQFIAEIKRYYDAPDAFDGQ